MTILFSLLLTGCATPVKTFAGYKCPHMNCTTHQAGYDWAKKSDIPNRRWCNSKNPYFNEGCVAWIKEKTGSEF